MLKVERHQALLELCAEHGSASVKEISDALGVSEMTVRRDLSELANMGKLVRVHGGARMPSSAHGTKLTHALTHVEKMQEHIDEKRAAARQAALIIQPGDTVFFGGGTSVEFMVDFLPDGPIRVITCSMPVFTALADRDNIELYLSGGIYRRRTNILRGLPGERALQSIVCDKAFIGATGIFITRSLARTPKLAAFCKPLSTAQQSATWLQTPARSAGVTSSRSTPSMTSTPSLSIQTSRTSSTASSPSTPALSAVKELPC